MNNDTHKIIIANYCAYEYYAVPTDWDISDVSIKWGEFHYKGRVQPQIKRHNVGNVDEKQPDTIEDNTEHDYYYDDFFECNDEDEKEE